jgi:hypothetical protein
MCAWSLGSLSLHNASEDIRIQFGRRRPDWLLPILHEFVEYKHVHGQALQLLQRRSLFIRLINQITVDYHQNEF